MGAEYLGGSQSDGASDEQKAVLLANNVDTQ